MSEQSFLVGLKKSYVLVPVVIIFSLILFYINNKFSSDQANKRDYVKLSLLTGFISTFIVYIHNLKGNIEEEIMSGPTPF